MEEYSVAGLEISEGTALLRNQGVNGTDAELRTAVERCAGHAYALVLLATLSRDYSMGLTTILKDPTFWKGDIAANLLDQIYTQLSEVQRELLRAFSLYREPVPLEAAQALITRTPKAKIPPVLKTLRTQQLIQAPGEGRYQLHAIVADYAQDHFVEDDEQANRQTLNAAHAKAAQYYLQQAKTDCPPRDRRRNADDVKPLIEAVWQYCQAGQWQEAYDLMLSEGLFSDLRRWGRNVVLLELCQLLLSSDKWQLERSQEGDIYHELAWVYDDLGKKIEAIKCYEQALEISRELGDRVGEGATLTGLGRTYDVLGKKEEARKCFEQALDIFRREVGGRRGEGTTLNNLGGLYSTLGKKQEALVYFEQALGIRREVGDRGGEGATLNNLGAVYDDLGKKQEALVYFEQALGIYREIGDRGGEGTTLNNLGKVYSTLGKKQEALECFEKALSISREVSNRESEGMVLWSIGALYFEQGEYDIALACFLLTRGILEEVQSQYRDGIQRWVDAFRKMVGEQQFATLLARVEPQAQQVVEQALRAGV